MLRRVGEGGGESGEPVGVLVGERLGERGEAVAVEERRVGVAGEERRMAQDAHEQVAVGDDAVDAGPLQRAGERPGGLVAGRRVSDHLGEQRVVVDADGGAGDHAGVEADARRRRVGELGDDPGHVEGVHRAALRLPPGGGILGVEAHLDGVARRTPAATAASRPPSATCSCRATRSRPVVHSVTGCSTCSRVFISRKKKLPSSSARNSTVPAPV